MIGQLEVLESEDIRINVYLRDGSKFIDKKISNQPTGEHERVVSFWNGDILTVYPLDLVQRYEFTFKNLNEREIT
jgi:hypothetical protein